MKSLWQQLIADETGVIISSELVLVGTVGVLGMVVGLEAVSSAVIQELNDLANAFGAVNQSYNVRSIAKIGHARVSGFGFNDRGDQCDCLAITQTDVVGASAVRNGVFGSAIVGSGTVLSSRAVVGPTIIVSPAPVVQQQILRERVINEVIVEPTCAKVVAPACCDGEMIEEHIIRRRVSPDCSPSVQAVPGQKLVQPVPAPVPEPKQEPKETKPKKKGG